MTTQEKRVDLAKSCADCWKYATIYSVALEGCKGYNNMSDAEIEELHTYMLKKGLI